MQKMYKNRVSVSGRGWKKLEEETHKTHQSKHLKDCKNYMHHLFS